MYCIALRSDYSVLGWSRTFHGAQLKAHKKFWNKDTMIWYVGTRESAVVNI